MVGGAVVRPHRHFRTALGGFPSRGSSVRGRCDPFTLNRVDAEASISEEPGARKPHTGICAGAVG